MNAPAWQAEITITRHLMPESCSADASSSALSCSSGRMPLDTDSSGSSEPCEDRARNRMSRCRFILPAIPASA